MTQGVGSTRTVHFNYDQKIVRSISLCMSEEDLAELEKVRKEASTQFWCLASFNAHRSGNPEAVRLYTPHGTTELDTEEKVRGYVYNLFGSSPVFWVQVKA